MQAQTQNPKTQTPKKQPEWLGDIPAHWEVKKLKRVLKFVTGGTPSSGVHRFYDGNEPWVTIGDMEGRKINKTHFISKQGVRSANIPLVEKGSLLYSFKLSVGQVAFANQNLYTNEAIASFLPQEGINLNYWYYALPIFVIRNAATNIYGAFILNQELIKNAYLPLPPLAEQQQIASFLDEKTGALRRAVAQKRRMVALLQERKQILIQQAVTQGLNPKAPKKESNLEWLGQIPKHWEVKRLASFGFFSKGGGFSKSSLVETGKKAILYGDIYTKYETRIESGVRHIPDDVAAKSVPIFEGDLLFTGSGETIEDIGKCVVYASQEEAYAGGDVITFRQNSYNSVFLSYYLNTEVIKAEKAKTAKGEIIVHTYASKLKNIKIPLPPLAEQAEIVAHLDAVVAKTDKAIALQEQQIAQLLEYEQVLIDNAVRGVLIVNGEL